MALSMTGYGRAQQVLNGREITAEIKSVNARYFEYSARISRSYNFAEEFIKKQVSAKVGRGKVDLYLGVQNLEAGEITIAANLPAAKGYRAALAEIAAVCGIPDDTAAGTLARLPDVFTLRRSEEDEEQVKADILQVLDEALARHTQMRQAEGEKLQADLLQRLVSIETMLQAVEEGSAGRVQRYTDKLYEKLQEILQDRMVDEARILTEAAIFADKTAVDEETVRLRSHLKQFRDIIEQRGAVGRKLDFLTQEINREANTIGSKCQELEITRVVVDIKAEIEKIREQIQNLE